MLRKIFILMVCAAFVANVNAQTDQEGSVAADSTGVNNSAVTDSTENTGNTNMSVMPKLDAIGTTGVSDYIGEMDLEDLQKIQIPDKWKNESAVILSRSTSYKYRITERGSGYYYYTREYLEFSKKTKERILLADQSVVDEYSEFLYSDDESVDVRIVKKDGTIVRTAQRHVVKKEVQIPVEDGYGRKSFVSAVYNKMAVPNLQVGDIIEVVEMSEVEVNWTTRFSIDLPAQYVPLQTSFPIMEQSFEIIADGLTVLAVSKNGAPDLDYLGNNKYSFKTGALEPYKGEMFNSYYRNSPYLKFAVYQCMSEGSDRFFGGCREVDEDLRPSADEVRKAAWHRIKAYEPLYLSDEIVDYVRKHGRNKDNEAKAKMAYYYLKHITLLNPASIERKPEKKDLEPLEISNEEFILTLSRAFNYLKIPCDLVVLTSRDLTSLDEMVMESEMELMLKTGTFDNPTYYYHFAELSDLQQLPTAFEGQDVYMFPYKSTIFLESETVKSEKIPFSTHEENTRFVSQELTLNLDELEIMGSRSTISSGHFKMGAAKRFLSKQDVERADSKMHKTKFFGNSVRPSSMSKKKFGHWQRKNRWAYNEWLEVRSEYGASGLENDNNVYDYDVNILNMGWNNDSAFHYVENYTADGLIMRAGDNYILDAGKLIDSQIEVNEEEHTRPDGRDIYVNYAKTYDNEIRIKIPAGYKAENVAALNYSVDNKTGLFESTAKVEGNTLVIITKKVYKKHHVKSSQWPEMTKFLDAAYDFTKQKILLKKL